MRINSTLSNKDEVTSGIPQGSVLGPLLFVIYINDLPDVVDVESHIYLFADDTKVFRKIGADADKTKLQCDLNNMCKWSTIGF